MLKFWKRILTPNFLAILLFEDGRKFGLGTWIVMISVYMGLKEVWSGEFSFLGVLIGASVATGGNMYDQWMKARFGVETPPPAARRKDDKTDAPAEPA